MMETVNYNNNTNINNVLSNKSVQIAAKKIVKKGRNHTKDLPKTLTTMLFS